MLQPKIPRPCWDFTRDCLEMSLQQVVSCACKTPYGKDDPSGYCVAQIRLN